tara:strand:+ start:490 stop:777 length:288 start_codon:yes stop_codon:yes gene_type:complete
LKLEDLDQHEYWGDDFKAGKSNFLLVRKDNGRHFVVISYGDVRGIVGEDSIGKEVTFFHTQTFAKTRATVVGFIDNDTDVSKFGVNYKVPTWTFK